MCGIVGILGRCHVSHIYDNLRKMMVSQSHRGPNDAGEVYWNHCGLIENHITSNANDVSGWGFNRLSIRDISQNGHQPMLDATRQVILCFNGEIYNANFLKTLVPSYHFWGNSDTEVILALYLEFGFSKMVRLLNGMFAITITDLRKHKTYIARDRLGIKPLYYFNSESCILISSEMKSIVATDYYSPSVDKDTLYEYFIFRNVTGNKNLFKDIYLFNPATIYEIDDSGEISSSPYFCFNDIERRTVGNISSDIHSLDSILSDAVQRQMVSDVSLGTQLSGGIDSSLVSFYMSRNQGINRSVSITFPNASFSEQRYMEVASRISGLDSEYIEFTTDNFLEVYEQTIFYMENMLPHSNCMGLFQLCKNASKNLSVLLSGEGADELLAGYSQHKDLKRRIDQYSDEDNLNYMIRYAYGKNKDDILNIMGEDRIEHFVSARKEIIQKFKGDLLEKQIKYELKTYLPELLIRQDKMSMASSVENRVPILDNEVLQFSLQMPVSHLFGEYNEGGEKNLVGKFPLKKLAEKIFGRDFAYRKKMGFAMPLSDFFSCKQFQDYCKFRIFPRMKERGFLHAEFVRNLFEGHIAKRPVNPDLLWRAVSFETWCQLYLDKREPECI